MRVSAFALLLCACATPTPAPAPAPAPYGAPAETAAMATDLLERGIGEARPDIVRALIAPTYTQHNPRVADGPQGLIGFVEEFAAGPRERVPRVKVLRSVVDGDLVALHVEYVRGGRRIAAVDLFRVENGKLAEHWDAGRSDGTDRWGVPTKKTPTTPAQNAQQKQQAAALAEAEGHAVHRVVGEGGLVVVQSDGVVEGAAAVIYDVVRFDVGVEIMERWQVFEHVPATSANANGMW